jgi:hypothetical protein
VLLGPCRHIWLAYGGGAGSEREREREREEMDEDEETKEEKRREEIHPSLGSCPLVESPVDLDSTCVDAEVDMSNAASPPSA